MRKWLIRIKDYPQISSCRFYQVRITDVGHKRKPDSIEVTLQHLSTEQEGRCHRVDLPLPIRGISSKAARLFAACGIEIAIGIEIEPRSVVGRVFEVRFCQNENGDYQPAEFRSTETNMTNDADKRKGGA